MVVQKSIPCSLTVILILLLVVYLARLFGSPSLRSSCSWSINSESHRLLYRLPGSRYWTIFRLFSKLEKVINVYLRFRDVTYAKVTVKDQNNLK